MSNRHDEPEHEGRFSEGEERRGEDDPEIHRHGRFSDEEPGERPRGTHDRASAAPAADGGTRRRAQIALARCEERLEPVRG